jgi:hypothetical protein
MNDSLADIIGQKASTVIEQTIIKTTFLSYYISMYNTVNENIGYKNASVTVDEIYDFIRVKT